MKTLKYLGMMSILLMSVFTFSACDSDDDDNLSAEESIYVGTWEYVFSYGSSKCTFNSNHKGVVSNKIYSDGELTESESIQFSWEVVDGICYITFNNDDGETETVRVYCSEDEDGDYIYFKDLGDYYYYGVYYYKK